MELRAFAEQVLFATTLEEKLRCPQAISDEHPGPPMVTPSAPGRPATLQFKAQNAAKSEFPGLSALEAERERGRLLHFFANHELLATELMALVLLRFPDAPDAFRRGVFQTLKDEQEHTRLYIDRMRACGIEFGELPVSGYFWRAVSGMENPMDYVAGLSLTFEQANLDFARQFAAGFARVGDAESAALLEKIYRDEIGHVAYGLKWFRRWKNPDESDWDAFCRQLKFPLSPQRAKGLLLNAEGRRAAGFDVQFIAELEVFSRSKGRTPSVFVFNPFTEGYLAQGNGFTPAKHQAQLARDLANLPQFLCRQDDIVLIGQRPSVEFLRGIKQAGFPLPEFVETGADARAAIAKLAGRKLGQLRPWAWGPDSLELLAPLAGNLSEGHGSVGGYDRQGSFKWSQLYSKAWSAGFLRQLLREMEPEAWLCTEDDVGVAVTALAHALGVIATIRARGHHKIVVKEALGVAGSNAIRLWEPELIEAHRRWMTSSFEKGRTLVIEPWLEREMDFSAQLEMTADGLKLCGYTGLFNDRKGQFQANSAAPNHARQIPAAVTSLMSAPADFVARLHGLYARLFAALEIELRAAGFSGPLGIDAFVYRTSQGDFRVKPVVEINPRYTMGRVTVELMKQVAPGRHGLFRLLNRATLKALGFDGFPACAKHLHEHQPLVLAGEPRPRIGEGALCLNDPAAAQVCLAVFEVTRQAKAGRVQ
jgi:uncharacterized ferritin-like protein (DUF455 family)